MAKLLILSCIWILLSVGLRSTDVPECYNAVDQLIWVVSDVEGTLINYKKLGFSQVRDFGLVDIESGTTGAIAKGRLVCANLGGAHVNWIQPMEGHSVFHDFLKKRGDGAMSLVHRFSTKEKLSQEIGRLIDLDVKFLDKITLKTNEGDLIFALMDTQKEGKYYLGFTYGESGLDIHQSLGSENRNYMKLNQYAFAIRNPEAVSEFWRKIGLPAIVISYPELGDPMYYGKPTDHELIQGWQRHGSITYEWCIPVKAPIVYEDHIQLHGEGIHHLAYNVNDMDVVLEDYVSRGFVVSMGGTWGEKGKSGSGRYEYIDLEQAGGLTLELLWNYQN